MYPYVLVCYSYVLMWCFSHDPLLCPPPVALVIYLPRKVYTYALHIFSLSIYPMKLHEFFFFLQALAGIFFSSSIPCMNFFFGSDTPPPRMSNGQMFKAGGQARCIMVERVDEVCSKLSYDYCGRYHNLNHE